MWPLCEIRRKAADVLDDDMASDDEVDGDVAATLSEGRAPALSRLERKAMISLEEASP